MSYFGKSNAGKTRQLGSRGSRVRLLQHQDGPDRIGGAAQISTWLLDTDYDGRSLFPRQVFFPMMGEKDGWARLARNLKRKSTKKRSKPTEVQCRFPSNWVSTSAWE